MPNDKESYIGWAYALARFGSAKKFDSIHSGSGKECG